jgi:hypothetical protein
MTAWCRTFVEIGYPKTLDGGAAEEILERVEA